MQFIKTKNKENGQSLFLKRTLKKGKGKTYDYFRQNMMLVKCRILYCLLTASLINLKNELRSRCTCFL